MDINRTHASSAQSEPQSPSEESRSPAHAAASTPPEATQEPAGALASLAGHRRSRSPDASEASERTDPSGGAQRPRKKLRTAHGVRFAESASEGSASAAGPSSSQPMARLRAMPRHEADDPEQRSINEQIARNQRALIDRLHWMQGRLLRRPPAMRSTTMSSQMRSNTLCWAATSMPTQAIVWRTSSIG